jgi:rare lipoprotein A
MFKTGIFAIFLFFLTSILYGQDNLPKFYFSQIGEATFYGVEFNNRKTSSGEIYKRDEFTAAHPFLAFGTSLKVTNLNNRKVTVVRINDRGPFKKGRIIDLSYAAAKQIDLVRSGVARVKLETLSEPQEENSNEVILYNDTILKGDEYYVFYQNEFDSTKVSKILSANGRLKVGLYRHIEQQTKPEIISEEKKQPLTPAKKEIVYALQVGAFINFDNANELKESMIRNKYKDVDVISIREKGGVLYKVTVGNFTTPEASAPIKNKLLKDNIIGFTIKKGS